MGHGNVHDVLVRKEAHMLDQQPPREDQVLHLLESSSTPFTLDEVTHSLVITSYANEILGNNPMRNRPVVLMFEVIPRNLQ
jgi:hypothetical protein